MSHQKPQSGIAGMRGVITAGGGGAGRVIAETLADMGCRVVVCDVDSSALTAALRATGSETVAGGRS